MRITIDDLKVMSVLGSGQEFYGEQLVYITGIKSGTIYNLLARLKKHRLVLSRWEGSNDRGGNRRRYHKLSSKGKVEFIESRESFLDLWRQYGYPQ